MKTKKTYQRPSVEVIDMGVPVLISYTVSGDDEVSQWSEEKNGGWHSEDWSTPDAEE